MRGHPLLGSGLPVGVLRVPGARRAALALRRPAAVAARHDRADRAGRPVRPPRLHAGRLGARLPALPPPRHAVRDPAAPARHRDRPGVPGDRRGAPAGARVRARRRSARCSSAGSRRRWCSTTPTTSRSRSTRVDGLDVAAIARRARQPRGRGRLPGRPRRGAHRRGLADRGAGQGRADRRPGPLHGAVADLRARRAGASRPAASSPSRPTTSLLANLDPTLERTPPPRGSARGARARSRTG